MCFSLIMFCKDAYQRLKQSKARTRIQWNLKDEDQEELYRDLGIIGEISNDEFLDCKSPPVDRNASSKSHVTSIKCSPSKSTKKEIDVDGDHPHTLIGVKEARAMKRLQRKRSRETQKPPAIFSSTKISRMDVNDSSSECFNIENGKRICFSIIHLSEITHYINKVNLFCLMKDVS